MELISASEEVEKSTNKDMSVKGTTVQQNEKGMTPRSSRIFPDKIAGSGQRRRESNGLFGSMRKSVVKVDNLTQEQAVMQINTIHDGFNSGTYSNH